MTKKTSYIHDDRFALVEEKMKSYNYQKDGLVEVLLTAQKTFGFLPKDVLATVAQKLRVPASKAWSVATFYDFFRVEKGGEDHFKICTGPVCCAAGAADVVSQAFQEAGISKPGETSANGKVTVETVSCLGLCDHAPVVFVNEELMVGVSEDNVFSLGNIQTQKPHTTVCGKPQVLTAPIGKIAPTDLEKHREEGAFAALEKALHDMTPEEVIEEVKSSRLTGRGGANFLTGLKWEFASKASGFPKYAVCNFDESEPGTFKDRTLMEGNPFRVIEGLALGAYAIGAHEGYIYIRDEYVQAQKTVDDAVKQAYAEHLLGDHILGTDYSFDLEVRHNPGAYVCGEETALFESIEGKRGYPRIKPPYPTQHGLFNQPTIINNVETLAVVPSLIAHGGEWFQQWGTGQSVGLKLFCVSGDVGNPCVVEAPYGLSIRELVEEFCEGFVGRPQAVLIGGASGGFIHPDWLDLSLTHEGLRRFGVPMGSGAIMVFNEKVDMWQVLESVARFFADESCGQCAPCRLGTKEVYNILSGTDLSKISYSEIRKLEEIGKTMEVTCICGLGMTAANTIRSYLRNIEVVT